MPDDDLKFIDPFEEGPSITGFDLLKRDGVIPPPPGELAPDQLRGRLWELIYALGSQRIFLRHTSHLSDQELYSWLHAHCLPRSFRDLPADEEWNNHVDVLGSGTEDDNQVWLKYYADDALREQWRRNFPGDIVPDGVPVPFNRDQWLPQPPAQLMPQLDGDSDDLELPGLAELSDPAEEPFTSPDELNDPLKLEAVDRAIHIEQPQFGQDQDPFESEEFSLETDPDADFEDDNTNGLSPEEILREPAVGIETENWLSPHVELVNAGVILPPPEEMTDEALPAKLWELLHELDLRGFYLLHTDHLDDRTLYSKLWRENLREPAILPGRSPSGGWYHDFIGTGSDEDTLTWLRYYADDLERAAHAEEFPEDPMPGRETRPARRDHRLPQGPF